MSVRTLHLSLFALCAVLLAGGCQRRPLDFKIQARSDLAFSLWVSAHTGSLGAEDTRELNEALKQIKFAVMIASPGLPAKEFSDQVYGQINGFTVRQVLARSLEIQSDRIAGEINALEERDERYRTIDPTSLSLTKRQFVESFNGRMADRRTELQRLGDRKTLLLAR